MVPPSLKLWRTGGRTSTKCFDFLGFNISRDGLRVSKMSVRKLAENVVLRLSSHRVQAVGQITPDGRAYYSESSSDYVTEQLTGKNTKGDLPVPDTVSKYVQRWLIWVKSVYEKKSARLPVP